jgi:choline kinase
MKYDLVILAAGLGSRLKSLTKNIPKAMVKYKGKRFIEIQINNIDKKYINKFIIVLGYKSIVLKKFLLKKFPEIKFEFVYNKNFRNNNSGQSFFYAYKMIKTKEYIHLNCDCIFSKNHFKKLIKSKFKNLVSVRSDIKLSDKMENVEAIKNKITKLSLINTLSSKYKAFGVAKISKNAMLKNINLYKKLTNKEKKVVNYYTLIRRNIKKVDYRLLKSNKNHLCEANFQKDLSNFDLENV